MKKGFKKSDVVYFVLGGYVHKGTVIKVCNTFYRIQDDEGNIFSMTEKIFKHKLPAVIAAEIFYEPIVEMFSKRSYIGL